MASKIMKPSEFQRVRLIQEKEITLPEPPSKKEIDGWDLPKEAQKFRPPDVPSDKEFNKMEKSDQIRFLKREMEKRSEGYWFYNNGNIEYMTGVHYFYCSYWKIDIGLPHWRDSDRDFFYFWDAAVQSPDSHGVIYITGRRQGKALDISTPIPTPSGWVTMEDLQEGDQVFASDGSICNVTFVTPVQHERKCYELTFSDGSTLVADEEHQWIAYNKSSRKMIDHPKWRAKKRVVTTKEMFENQKVGKKNESNWSIEVCGAARYPKRDLAIPPYILGLWLGDGHSKGARITNIDEPILNDFREYVEELGLDLNPIPNDPITYVAKIKDKSKNPGNKNSFNTKLRSYDLINNKHIPDDYLQADRWSRHELLKGLMDTDGSIHQEGASCEFCTKFDHLADQVLELACSLGYKARKTSKYNKKVGRSYYYVRFSHGGRPPFKLQRKIDGCVGRGKGGWRSNHRYITSIVEVESRPVKCIQVDSEDSSYLCGKNYITTHNTSLSTCILYEATSKVKERQSGIQSKTNKDSKGVFNKLISSWKKLPSFWKPADSGESRPSSALKFQEPSTRSTKNKVKEYKDYLDSFIDYAPSVEEAYDGTKQFRLLHDEVGKKSDADVWERWNICKPCMEVGINIVGKALLTTTVEEIEDDGCKKIWMESDHMAVDEEDPRTISGLWRYFKPAYLGHEGFIDEYGYSVVEDPAEPIVAREGHLIKYGCRTHLERKRKKLTGKGLYQEIRKFPFTIQEAFRVDSKLSMFDTDKCYDQMNYNASVLKPMFTTGNFVWKNGERDSEVIWQPSPNGKWKVAWHPPEGDRNRHSNLGGQRRPTVKDVVSGCDPFDHKVTTDNRKSNAASYGLRKYNPLDPNTGNFVTEYIGRPPKPEIFWEDMILQNRYYSSEMLVENNKPGLINYFRQRGYEGYLMSRPDPTHTAFSAKNQKELGIPMTGEAARSSLIEHLQSYIYDYIGIKEDGTMGNCPFDFLLEDWIKFEVDAWTKYDATVASGLAVLASKKFVYKQETFDVFQFHHKYNNKGKLSRRL